MSVCTALGPALSLCTSMHGAKGTGDEEKGCRALLAYAKSGQKDIQKESETNREKV